MITLVKEHSDLFLIAGVWWPIVVTEFFCIDRLKIVSMKIIFFNL